MKIQRLFDELETKYKTENAESIFDESGMIMITEEHKLNYGFFPAGSGILVEGKSKIPIAEINEGGVMILGNDFQTLTYLNKLIKNGKIEDDSVSVTMNNLKKLNLKKETTFYSNFYLGVRNDEKYPCQKATKRCVKIEKQFKVFCDNFFLTQLKLINPKIVICLGHSVRLALAENIQQFAVWKSKSISFKELYSTNNSTYNFVINIDDNVLGKRKFIVIPHPCDSRNFRGEHIEHINKIIKHV